MSKFNFIIGTVAVLEYQMHQHQKIRN